MLARNQYTERELCDRLDVATIADLKKAREGRELVRHFADPQALLVRLFLDGDPVPWSVVRSVLLPEDVTALETLGLVTSEAADETACVGTVLLYPVEGCHIVSDRITDSGPSASPADVVYPAVTSNTNTFMALFSRERCDDFLELCSGTGLAALVAARDFAGSATAIDITERATRFARFNAKLNAIDDVHALQGDLYEPVRGRTFDRIVAHPPYMPAFEQEYVYRDGGEDGEQITRRIIAGLPEFLRPGGRYYSACLATDRTGAPLEMRIRELLGDHSDEFDVAILQGGVYTPAEYFFKQARVGGGSLGLFEARVKAFREMEVESIVYGMLILQRRAESRPVITTRRQLAVRVNQRPIDLDAVEWLLRWEMLALDPSLGPRLLDAAPRRNPRLQMRQLAVPRGHDWAVDRTWVDVLAPFTVEASTPFWVPVFLSAADGRQTGREHLEALKRKGLAPEQTSDEEFAGMLVRFMGVGMFDIASFPLPSGPPEPREERVRVPAADQ
jgi:SAM-dependent methyltransferase